MNTSRLQMGYASYTSMKEKDNWDSKPRINMFKVPNLYPTFLSSNKTYTGIILPAFDNATYHPSDPAYKTSWIPYRSRTEVITKGEGKGFGAFTDWFIFLLGYSYYGDGMSTFVSPVTVGEPDPIQEIRKYIYTQKNKGIADYEYLVERGKARNDVRALPPTSRLMLMNVYSGAGNAKSKDQSVCNRVLILKEQAANKLFNDLNELRPAAIDRPFDPDWPHFLYGDPTNPERAIEVSSVEYSPAQGFPGIALSLGEVNMISPGTMNLNTRRVQITQDMLMGRYELNDVENVIHIPSYEEIVDLLVAESLIPYNLIKTVCESKYNGSFPSPNGTVSVPSKPVAQVRPAAPVRPSNPPYVEMDQKDEIPGLESHAPVHQDAVIGSSPMTNVKAAAPAPAGDGPLSPAELARLEELQKLIQTGQAESDDYSEFQRLNRRHKVTV